ncbi:palmitoyltransferase for Vac8p [Aspergillus viridinutans]|uniref:Palmitoyltransferase PFA4 n=1 Tax=Aspergillus viridinutans TaxID=75553 RepID=A0A9P3C493_ASPVI|nr:palmitoyltransferase for Vac8p [Aspergillus viridinutans]GIK07312.1 palmitoyltransferase for Vac8p [Aspergillus viridinutans]
MLCRSFNISQLAIPFVSALISFLAYTSQLFFYYFKEAPLRSQEFWRLNIFALCIWVCYYRACTVDPGRIPKDWMPSNLKQLEKDCAGGRQRWCRRCEAFKPPRAHHCKTCQRCIPKMDHHCPWTSNCISHFTYPHFMRFLFYAVVGMGYLETLLFERASIVWASRHLPSYLGPSLGQLAHLFILLVVNSLTWLALFILLLRSLWSLALNTTTIESWEIERHETLLRRARHFGGYLSGPGGIQLRIKKQEFPYDIGIWSNIKAGMGGSANVLSWFWPFAATPDRSTGLEYEVNGFEDPNLSWPPPDPDRIPFPAKREDLSAAIAAADASYHRAIQARNNQLSNDASHSEGAHNIQRRKRFHDRFNENKAKERDSESESDSSDDGEAQDGEEGWKNSEGDRLRDFGVDEEVDFYDEEDIPLGILMQRRRQQ